MDYNEYLLGGKNPNIIEPQIFEENKSPQSLTITIEPKDKNGNIVNVFGPALAGYLAALATSAIRYMLSNVRSYLSGVDPFSGLLRQQPSRGYKDGVEANVDVEEFKKEGIEVILSTEEIDVKISDDSLDARDSKHHEEIDVSVKKDDEVSLDRETAHKEEASSLEPTEVTPETIDEKVDPDSITPETIDEKLESTEVTPETIDEKLESTEVTPESIDEKVDPDPITIETIDEKVDPDPITIETIDEEKEGKKVPTIDLKFLHKREAKSFDELDKLRPSVDSIGYILVIPQGVNSVENTFKIPFEFNPEIDEGNYSATYNAQTILARIGALQNYSHTDISAPSIKTDYMILAKDDSPSTNKGNEWMNNYTPEKVQAIQRAYQSLVFPKFPKTEEESINVPFSYNRPPFVKVILGNGNSDTSLFTYPKLSSNDLKSHSIYPRHKLFLVTSVKIDKDLNKDPIIIEDGKIFDVVRFSVNIDLLEVTKNYMDMYPDYETYFKSFHTAL